jgi:hypothetical protein
LCKTCCRSKCYLENKDCAGHRILIKTRREKAREYAALEQRKAESQSDRTRDHHRAHCEQVVTNGEIQKNAELNKSNWEQVMQAGQVSALRQEQCFQLDKKQKMTNEQDVHPELNVESTNNRTNDSLTNSIEHQCNIETVDNVPQHDSS